MEFLFMFHIQFVLVNLSHQTFTKSKTFHAQVTDINKINILLHVHILHFWEERGEARIKYSVSFFTTEQNLVPQDDIRTATNFVKNAFESFTYSYYQVRF